MLLLYLVEKWTTKTQRECLTTPALIDELERHIRKIPHRQRVFLLSLFDISRT